MTNSTTGLAQNVSQQVRRLVLDLQKKLGVVDGKVDKITSASSTVDHGALVGLADDDHGQYALSNGTRGLFEVSGAVTNHAAAGDPHTQYTTTTEAKAQGDLAVSQHVALADPHAQYLLPAEGDAAYDAIGSAAAVNNNLNAHLTDAIDAHDASAVSYDGTANSLLVKAWLTANELNAAVGQLAGQLYTPDAETTQQLINALNALVVGTPLSNEDVFSSNLIVARHLASGSVTAGKIDAQAVTTAALAANAVTAAKLAVTRSGANLVANPGFEDADFAGTWGWVEGGITTGFAAVFDATAPEGSKVASIPSGGFAALGSRAFSVTPGTKYRVRSRIKHANGTGTLYYRVNWKSDYPSGDFVTINNRTDTSEFLFGFAMNGYTAWTQLDHVWTVPAGAKWASLSFYNWDSTGLLYVDDVQLVEQFASTNIADGVITTDKIQANAITAEKIQADAITSSNYSYVSGNFTATGSKLDLATGTFRTPGLFVNGASPFNVAVKGAITATQFSLLRVDNPAITSATFVADLGDDEPGYNKDVLKMDGNWANHRPAELSWNRSDGLGSARLDIRGPSLDAYTSKNAPQIILLQGEAGGGSSASIGAGKNGGAGTTGYSSALFAVGANDASLKVELGGAAKVANFRMYTNNAFVHVNKSVAEFTDLDEFLINGVRQDSTAWTNVGFENFFSNYGTPFGNVQYRREGDRVFLRGMIKRASAAAITYLKMFTIPVGLRPPSVVKATCISFNADAGGVNKAIEVDIGADGAVQTSSTIGANFWLSFECSWSLTA